MRAPLPHQLPYRADIDGLRAVAILSVIAYHYYGKHVPGGFIGVDIFFVISGFLISSLIIDAVALNRFSYIDFYSRRIRRIFPALLLVLIAVFIAGALVLYPPEYRLLKKFVISSILFVSNFAAWTQAGYFAGGSRATPLLHLWSLGVEEQFYLFYHCW
jgi:peptidoglycan/LPS O-acetylase OafA/YrhL